MEVWELGLESVRSVQQRQTMVEQVEEDFEW